MARKYTSNNDKEDYTESDELKKFQQAMSDLDDSLFDMVSSVQQIKLKELEIQLKEASMLTKEQILYGIHQDTDEEDDDTEDDDEIEERVSSDVNQSSIGRSRRITPEYDIEKMLNQRALQIERERNAWRIKRQMREERKEAIINCIKTIGKGAWFVIKHLGSGIAWFLAKIVAGIKNIIKWVYLKIYFLSSKRKR